MPPAFSFTPAFCPDFLPMRRASLLTWEVPSDSGCCRWPPIAVYVVPWQDLDFSVLYRAICGILLLGISPLYVSAQNGGITAGEICPAFLAISGITAIFQSPPGPHLFQSFPPQTLDDFPQVAAHRMRRIFNHTNSKIPLPSFYPSRWDSHPHLDAVILEGQGNTPVCL